MSDIFDNTILCKNCDIKMTPISVDQNGFHLRAVKCKKCSNKILHPEDLKKYDDFINLRKKQYKVKLRLVGNSYAVSIPKEILNFMNEQEQHMNEIVKLCFEDLNKISLNF